MAVASVAGAGLFAGTPGAANAAPVDNASATVGCTMSSSVTLAYKDASKKPKVFEATGLGCNSTSASTVQNLAAAATYHQFTPADPFDAEADSDGTITAQVTYSTQSLPVAFGYQISPALQAIATSTVKASITETRTACHYSKVGAPVDYPFHWNCPSHSSFTNYVDSGTFVFTWEDGTVTININYRYNINLGGPSIAHSVAQP